MRHNGSAFPGACSNCHDITHSEGVGPLAQHGMEEVLAEVTGPIKDDDFCLNLDGGDPVYREHV